MYAHVNIERPLNLWHLWDCQRLLYAHLATVLQIIVERDDREREREERKEGGKEGGRGER